MEVVASAIAAVGQAISAWATAYAFIYIVGIGTKTFLIYTDKAKSDDLKNWFDFKILKKDKGL